MTAASAKKLLFFCVRNPVEGRENVNVDDDGRGAGESQSMVLRQFS